MIRQDIMLSTTILNLLEKYKTMFSCKGMLLDDEIACS